MSMFNSMILKRRGALSRAMSFRVNNDYTTALQVGSGSNTYTCSTPRYVQDFEGLLKYVAPNCPAFVGQRNVTNLLTYSEDFSNAAWTENGGTIARTANDASAPDGSITACKFVFSGANVELRHNVTVSDGSLAQSVWLKGTAGETILYGIAATSGTTNQTLTLTGGWQRVSYNPTTAVGVLRFWIGTWSGATARTIWVWHPQLENVTGSTNQNPSEYCATTTAPVTRFFDYANPYTVADGVVTDSGIRAALPTTYLKAGVLSEPSGSNLCLQSQTLNVASWAGANTTLLADLTTAPDGTLTAELMYPTTTGLDRGRTQTITGITATTTYTTSVYAKAGGLGFLLMGDVANVYNNVWFDLNNGTASAPTVGVAQIVAVGNGWYRCSCSSPSVTTTGYIYLAGTDASGSRTATTSGTNGIYLWGAQLETGSVATSYMPTTTSTATRAATSDGYDKANSKLGDITVRCRFVMNSMSASYGSIFGHTTGNAATCQWNIYYDSGLITFQVANGTTIYSASYSLTLTMGVTYKVVGRLTGTTLDVFVNGVKGTPATLTGTQVTNTGNILYGGGGAYAVANAYMSEAFIYNTALSDQDCIRLTT